jgi:hypothetical protein
MSQYSILNFKIAKKKNFRHFWTLILAFKKTGFVTN